MCTTFGCDRGAARPASRLAGSQAWNTEEEGKPQTFHFLPQLANLPQQLCIAQLRELGRLERCWLKKSWK